MTPLASLRLRPRGEPFRRPGVGHLLGLDPGPLRVPHREAHALELAPYGLTLSRLDCEAIDLMMGFDFTYRGNQNQLIAEALGVCPAFERLAGMPGAAFISGVTLQIDGAASLGKPNVWPLAKHDKSQPFDGFHRAVTPEVLK